MLPLKLVFMLLFRSRSWAVVAISCLRSIARSYCMHFFSGILYMYEHLQLKPAQAADINFLQENMVNRTASVVTNGPGCSDASFLAETHLKDKISSA